MVSLRLSRAEDCARLHTIWRRAVLATHDFLGPGDFAEIERIVADEYLPKSQFWLAVDAKDCALGFMGLSGTHIDSLFVDPDAHGIGIGRTLVEHALRLNPVLSVDVNEQNTRAVAFYERLGFRRIGRSPRDESGRPYPLLHMSL